MSKDRGAEQGDVDGPAMVAAETRERMAARQVAGSLPWIGVDDPPEEQRLQADHATMLQETANFQLGGPEKLTGADDPRHALQEKRKLNKHVIRGSRSCAVFSAGI